MYRVVESVARVLRPAPSRCDLRNQTRTNLVFIVETHDARRTDLIVAVGQPERSRIGNWVSVNGYFWPGGRLRETSLLGPHELAETVTYPAHWVTDIGIRLRVEEVNEGLPGGG